MRVRTATGILSTVWQRAFLDALLAPRRFRAAVPEFWRASTMLFHPGVKTLKLSDVPGSDHHISLLSSGWSTGGMPPQDLYALMRLVRWIEPKTIFEIGTFTGITTAHLGLNSTAQIYTLDMPRDIATGVRDYSAGDLDLLQPREQIGTEYRGRADSGRIHQLFGDSRAFDYTAYRGLMDLVLVDGCHVYEGVLEDSRNALAMLSPGGALVWHDFANLYDVTRAVTSFAGEHAVFHIEGTWLAIHVRNPREQQLASAA